MYLAAGAISGRLTTLEVAQGCNDKVLCRCSCGEEKRIRARAITSNQVQSCGCLRLERSSESNRSRRLPPLSDDERRARNRQNNATYRERHREELRERHREWAKAARAADPVAIRARAQRWEDANREKLRAGKRARRAADPEARRAAERRTYAANPEKYRESSRRTRIKNPAAALAAARRWQLANPEAVNAAWSRRRQRVEVNMDQVDRLLSVCYRKAIREDPCYYCGTTAGKFHIDHYIPLAIGGTDHWWNLVRACVSCNQSKHAQHGDDFMKAREGRWVARHARKAATS